MASSTDDRGGRGPLALMIAGIVMTVVGWLVFVLGIFVIVGEGEGPDANTGLQDAALVVTVLSAVVGSVGPFLITGGAIWWAIRARVAQPSGPSWRSGGVDISG